MRLPVLFICLLVTPLLFGQTKTNLELTDIFNMEYVSDPQISPDGNQILYVRNFKDIMTDKNLSNIWLVNSDGSKNRPITTGNQNDFYPRWSHTGDKIIFKSNRQDARMKLFVMWMDSKEIAPLTNTPKAPGAVSWSPNDRYLAFTMFVPKKEESIVKMPAKPEGAKWNTPPTYIDKLNYRGDGQGYLKGGNTQLFTLSIDGGTPKQLTSTDFDHGAAEWSKDGKKLYFSANFNPDEAFEPNDSEIYELSLGDKAINAFTDRYGPDDSPRVSPDGTKMAYTGLDDKLLGYQQNQLYVRAISGGTATLLSGDFDRNISNIQWANDGRGLFFQYDDKGEIKVAHMSLSGKVTEKVN
jgi:Tol biopolymer transport system component